MKVKIPKYKKNIIKILTAFFVLFPWITYTKILEFSDAEKSVFSSQQGLSLDFFLYSKEVVLLMMAVVALIWFFGERVLVARKDNNIPLIKGDNKWLFIASGVFAVFTLIATIFAEQKKNALWGSPTEGEGLWVLLSYIVLILLFYNYFASDYGLNIIKTALIIVSVLTVVLTLIEYFYKPLLEIGFVKMLVAPAEYAQIMESVEATVFTNSVSLTFFNPGYFGGFVCLLLPFAMVLCLKAEKLLHKLLFGVLTLGLIFCVVTANTTTSLYLAIMEVVLVLALMLWNATDKKAMALAGGCLGAAAVVAVILSGLITGNNIGGLLTNANSATGKEVEERFVITDIALKKNTVTLVGEEKSLQIIHEAGILTFADENGEAISVSHEGGKYDILGDGYEYVDVYIAYSGSTEGEPAAKIFVDAGYDNTIDFLILRNGLITGVGQLDAIVTDIDGNDIPERMKKYYGLFTGRGYAWINSMPILKETILIGKGPGNFAFYFNQSDYVGLLATHEDAKSIIDKPHNAYLQYAINLGIPGMVAFFGIIVIALWKAVKVWKENKEQNISSSILHVGAMVSVCGFLVYSIINDSMITVTPTLCMLVGILLATTYVQKNQ